MKLSPFWQYICTTNKSANHIYEFLQQLVVIPARTSVQRNNKNNQEYEAVMARHGVLQTFPVHQVVQKYNLLTRLLKNITCSPGCSKIQPVHQVVSKVVQKSFGQKCLQWFRGQENNLQCLGALHHRSAQRTTRLKPSKAGGLFYFPPFLNFNFTFLSCAGVVGPCSRSVPPFRAARRPPRLRPCLTRRPNALVSQPDPPLPRLLALLLC